MFPQKIRQTISLVLGTLDSTEPWDCFKFQIQALKVIGAFHEPEWNIFMKCLSKFGIFLHVNLCVMSALYLGSSDVLLEDKLLGSFTANTSLLCVIKMYYIGRQQEQLVNIVKDLKSRVNDTNAEETAILRKEAIYPTVASYLMLQSAICMSVPIYAFFPVGKNNSGQPLPVFAWYPHFMNFGITYNFIYILQFLSCLCAGSLWVCVDTINFGLLAHHSAMLKILGRRLALLGHWNGADERRHQRNYVELCELVKYHNQISIFRTETNQIYGSILFAKITLSVVIICSFVYSLGVTTENYGGLFAQFVILGVIVSTLFVQSWMSEKISVNSIDLPNKAAECNFQDMDRRTAKALIIFMEGLNSSGVVEVGTIFKVVLNLKMFVTIMEFAYKCLTLLKTAKTQNL